MRNREEISDKIFSHWLVINCALHHAIKYFFLTKILNAWVLIFCLKSLEIAFLTSPFLGGKGSSAPLVNAGCKHQVATCFRSYWKHCFIIIIIIIILFISFYLFRHLAYYERALNYRNPLEYGKKAQRNHEAYTTWAFSIKLQTINLTIIRRNKCQKKKDKEKINFINK